MLRRFSPLIILLFCVPLLSGCLTSSEVKPRTGVNEARACMKTLQNDPAAVPGYVIRACTNTGVWLVDEVGPDGQTVAQYDFVNGDYAGAETGFSPVPVDSLAETTIARYKGLHESINHTLIEPAGGSD